MIENILWAVGGFVVGGFVVAKFMGFAFRTYLEHKHPSVLTDLLDKREEVNPEPKDEIITVKVEEHFDTFYIFKADNDQFLAQGNTYNEIKQLIRSKYPEATIIADNTDSEAFKRLKATA